MQRLKALLIGNATAALLLMPGFTQVGERTSGTSQASSQAANRQAAALELKESMATDEILFDLLGAVESAQVRLGSGYMADQLQTLHREARWVALFDGERALRGLKFRMQERQRDLAFQPLIEAPLPEGWPTPTPVGEIQLKEYPIYRMGQTGAGKSRGGGAFWTLFQHIQSNDIAMTAPVEMTYDKAEGADSMREVRMAFLYASTDLGEAGKQGSVRVEDIPALRTISLGCRGFLQNPELEGMQEILLQQLANYCDFEVAGPLRVMGYNSPMVPVKNRYYEVEVPIREKTPSDNAKAPEVKAQSTVEPELTTGEV